MKIHTTAAENRATRHVSVVLSERNLRDLLAAYEAGDAAVLRRFDLSADIALTVAVESDAAHYRTREAGPGYADAFAPCDPDGAMREPMGRCQ